MMQSKMFLQGINDLCCRIKTLPADYASLSDTELAQMSAFFVALQVGLGNFINPYKEVKKEIDGMDRNPFSSIYAELVHRILGEAGRKSENRPALAHALYLQAICTPNESYGKFGDEGWVYDTLFEVIDNYIPKTGKYSDYALLELAIDTFHILGSFEPKEEGLMETVLTEWNAEKEANGWRSLTANDVAQRLGIITAHNDLSNTDLVNPVAQSVNVLDEYSPVILNGADASGLFAYRTALRNTYCYDSVSTKFFVRLEQKVIGMKEKSLSRELLQAILLVDRLEWELAALSDASCRADIPQN